MRLENIGGYAGVDEFVKAKLNRFNTMEHSFSSLYELMFSEKDNVIFEKNSGYRIEKTTYGKCRENVERRASALAALLEENEKNSVVGLYLDNGIEWIETFWSILRAGYRPLLMNLRLPHDVLDGVLEDLGAVAVISAAESFSVKNISAGELTTDCEPLTDGAFGDEILLMSSGTSANLKICAYSAEEFYYQVNDSYSIITECAQIKKHYDGELKQLTFLPFYHIFGLVAVYIWFAFFSRTFVNLNDMTPSTIINTIRRHKVTHIFAVPLFWNKVYTQAISTIKDRGDKTWAKFEKGLRISEKLAPMPALANAFRKKAFREVRENMFGESVQFMITGGSEIRTEVISFFNNIGYHLADGYGMTEIGITSVELSNDTRVLNSRSVGKPMSSIEYKINDSGELLVRGKAVAKYIIVGNERTERGEWFNTHDLAECRDGRYYILGRRDDLVISPTGENLNPNMIEPMFDGIRGLKDVCLIGVKENENVVPTLIVSTDKYIGEDGFNTLKDAVRARIAEEKLGSQIGRVHYTARELIRGQEIKLNRRKIAEDYRNGRLTELTFDGKSKELLDDRISEVIVGIFAKSLGKPESEITYDYDFFTDGGGTSLDYFAAVSMLNTEFGISLPVADGKSLSSVSDIHDFIEGQIN